MYCINCGNKLNDGDRFCTACGTPVPQMTQRNPAPGDTSAPASVPAAEQTETSAALADEKEISSHSEDISSSSFEGDLHSAPTQEIPVPPIPAPEQTETPAAPVAEKEISSHSEDISSSSFMGNPQPNLPKDQFTYPPVPTEEIPSGISPEPPVKKGIKPLAVVLIVLGAFLIFAALAFSIIFFGLKASDPPSETTTIFAEESSMTETTPEQTAEPTPEATPEATPEPAQQTMSKRDIYDIYEDIVEDLLEEYGAPAILSDTSGFPYSTGLVAVRLVDFDQDGTEELYCAFSNEQHRYNHVMYGVKDGKAVNYIPLSSCSNNGTDVSPTTQFAVKDGKNYLLVGPHVSYEGDMYTLTDGKWICVDSFKTENVGTDNAKFLLNGEALSQDDYFAAFAEYSVYEKLFYSSNWELNPLNEIVRKTEVALDVLMEGDYSEDYKQQASASSQQEQPAQQEQSPQQEQPAQQEQNTQQGSSNSYYILPDSSSRYLTGDDLAGLSDDQLELARNEIYARHGRKFVDDEIRAYFESQSWYQGTIEPENFDPSVLSDVEVANIDLILQYED